MFGLGLPELLIIVLFLAAFAVPLWISRSYANKSVTIERVATGQKLMIYALLVYLFSAVLKAVFGEVGGALGGITGLILSLVGLFYLGSGMGYPLGVIFILFVLMILPVINLITMLILNSRATKALRAADYKVGLFGASRQFTQKSPRPI